MSEGIPEIRAKFNLPRYKTLLLGMFLPYGLPLHKISLPVVQINKTIMLWHVLGTSHWACNNKIIIRSCNYK
jgi:hypothetical protein